MSVIEASSVRCQTMADGTLRVTMDIEPRNAQDAFALFAAPGTPMALAALRTGPALTIPKTRIGPNCMHAVEVCRDERFWQWVHFATIQAKDLKSEAQAASYVYEVCNVSSRKEFDADPEAYRRFLIRLAQPFNSWLERRKEKATA